MGDNGKVKGLVNGLDKSSLIRGISERKEDLKENKKLLALIDNFAKTRGTHGFWACKSISLYLFNIYNPVTYFFYLVKFYVVELLNIVNIIAQSYFTNYFLKGYFGLVALQGLGVDENISILPITASCFWQS